MDKKQLFKIQGTFFLDEFSRKKNVLFEGYFVRRGKSEIVGINCENGEAQFIKGLFINCTQLIFVEIATDKRSKAGYAFKNVKKAGIYSPYDWLSGVFSGDDDDISANIQVKRWWNSKKIKEIERKFEDFYKELNDFDKYFFDTTYKLTDYL